MVDLLMLGLLEGFDRTEPEYRELLDKAGFEVVAARASTDPAAESVLEAVARH
jgi:hypothetical protein